MNTALEPLEHAPESFVLSLDQQDSVDDMSDFIDQVKAIVKAELAALEFSDSAVAELADIYVGV